MTADRSNFRRRQTRLEEAANSLVVQAVEVEVRAAGFVGQLEGVSDLEGVPAISYGSKRESDYQEPNEQSINGCSTNLKPLGDF